MMAGDERRRAVAAARDAWTDEQLDAITPDDYDRINDNDSHELTDAEVDGFLYALEDYCERRERVLGPEWEAITEDGLFNRHWDLVHAMKDASAHERLEVRLLRGP